jgi:hypothetical protein
VQEPVIPAKQRADCLRLGRDSGALRDEPALREMVQWLSPLVRRALRFHASVSIRRQLTLQLCTRGYWADGEVVEAKLRVFCGSFCISSSTAGAQKELTRPYQCMLACQLWLLPGSSDARDAGRVYRQAIDVEHVAQAFAPAIMRDISATDLAAAQTFVELLLLAPWNPALPPVASRAIIGSDSPASPLDEALAASSGSLEAADVVSIGPVDTDSDGAGSAGATGTGWQRPDAAGGTGFLFAGGGDETVRELPTRDSDTDDDTSRMTAAPESTAVESFKMSPPSTYAESPDSDDTATAAPKGPAWTTQVDQEDVLSSLEFANPTPMFRTAGADMILDDEIDDLEMEDLETL